MAKKEASALRDKYVILFGIFFVLLSFVVLGGPTGYVISQTDVPEEYVTGTGTLYVTSSPQGADIYVDGEFRAKSPVKVISLEEGYHRLEARAPGYSDYEGMVTVTEGDTTRVAVSLQRNG